MNLKQSEVQVISGIIPPIKRQKFWEEARIACATPQTMLNDMRQGRVPVDQISLIIFDEMHLAGDDYDYVDIATIAEIKKISRLGLTATPGLDHAQFDRALSRLKLSEYVIRTAEDSTVGEHLHVKYEFKHVVPLTSELRYYEFLIDIRMRGIYDILRQYNYVYGDFKILSIKELGAIITKARAGRDEEGNIAINKVVLTNAAEFMKLRHLLLLLMTENYTAVYLYFEKLFTESRGKNKVKASERIINDPRLQVVRREITEKYHQHVKHPKILRLIDLLYNALHKSQQVIVFANNRDSQTGIYRALQACTGLSEKSAIIHSESTKTGKAKNVEAIENFISGKIPILISTSILEAGIHIPVVDIIINYSLPLEESTMVQRWGRVGRTKDGEVHYLASAHSFDMNLLYATFAKKRRMLRTIKDFSLGFKPPEQLKLFA